MHAPQWIDQLVRREVVGEVVALDVVEFELAADVLRQPARDLDAADVLADGVVRAGLGDEHAVAGLQVVDGQRPADELDQVALEAGEEDREAWSAARRAACRPATLRKACESVTTRAGGRFEAVQGVAQLALLDDQAIGVVVEQVADGSAPAAGSAGPWAPPCRSARPAPPARPAAPGRRGWSAALMKSSGASAMSASRRSEHALAASLATGRDDGHLARPCSRRPAARRRRPAEVGLVEDDDDRRSRAGRARRGSPPRTRPTSRPRPRRCRRRCGRRPGASARRACSPSAPTSSMPAVSMNSTGPIGQQLHRLLDRVGGRAGHVGDDRHLLPRQGVEQRRLADVAPAEDAACPCMCSMLSLPPTY